MSHKKSTTQVAMLGESYLTSEDRKSLRVDIYKAYLQKTKDRSPRIGAPIATGAGDST